MPKKRITGGSENVEVVDSFEEDSSVVNAESLESLENIVLDETNSEVTEEIPAQEVSVDTVVESPKATRKNPRPGIVFHGG